MRFDRLRGRNREYNKDEIKEAFLNLISSERIFTGIHHANLIFTIVILTFILVMSLNTILIFLFIYIILLLILVCYRIYIFYKKQLTDNFYNEELDLLIPAFKNYLGKKGTRRDNKKIELIINRIEKADMHFRNFKITYGIMYFLWILMIYFFMIFSIRVLFLHSIILLLSHHLIYFF